MNALLLNPPFHERYSRSQRSPAVIKSGVMYYPIWLAYATGALEQSGFEVDLVDAPARGYRLPYVIELAAELQPQLVVVDTSTPSIHNDVQVAEAIRHRLPQAFVLLVGPHVSALPAATLRLSDAIDAVARGEYDHTVRDLAEALDGSSDLTGVKGLSFRAADGQIVHNVDRPLIENLDALPMVSDVYRRHLTVEDYFYSITRYPEVAILSGRGCPYRCTFCVWPQTLTGRQYRRRSPANVADEFQFIAEELPQVKEVFVEDDTLTASKSYALELARELIARDNRLPFSANSRADVGYEALRALKRAGLRLLCVGFESGDQELLNAVRKGIRLEQVFEFRAAARRAGVLVHGCFMAGIPGETEESREKTLSLAKRLNPDTAQFYPLMVYPGTEAYEWARKNGCLSSEDFRDWLTPEGLHRTTVQLPGMSSEDLAAWCDDARRSFYLRPRYVVSKAWQMLRRPGEVRRVWRAAGTFARYLMRPVR